MLETEETGMSSHKFLADAAPDIPQRYSEVSPGKGK